MNLLRAQTAKTKPKNKIFHTKIILRCLRLKILLSYMQHAIAKQCAHHCMVHIVHCTLWWLNVEYWLNNVKWFAFMGYATHHPFSALINQSLGSISLFAHHTQPHIQNIGFHSISMYSYFKHFMPEATGYAHQSTDMPKCTNGRQAIFKEKKEKT